MNIKVILAVTVGGVLLASAAVAQLARKNYNEPKHEVVFADGAFEIRRYAPRIVAETRVSTKAWDAAVSQGFSRLAGYIFGGNTTKDGSMKIAMTTPVESVPEGDAQIVVFTMPPEHTMADLPAPNDARVTLREVPETTVATLVFKGQARGADLKRLTAELLELTAAQGYTPTSEVKLAQYDPPWVLGPMRRNEMMVDVTKP